MYSPGVTQQLNKLFICLEFGTKCADVTVWSWTLLINDWMTSHFVHLLTAWSLSAHSIKLLAVQDLLDREALDKVNTLRLCHTLSIINGLVSHQETQYDPHGVTSEHLSLRSLPYLLYLGKNLLRTPFYFILELNILL